MPLPVRSLSVISNWDCAGCSNCCRTYHVKVNDDEKKRIQAMDWSHEPALKGVEPIVYDRRIRGERLNHGDDGTCVFLGPDNRCRIHDKYGSAAKPLACRMFPFLLVPAGDHWRVSLRYSCPTVVADRGRPIAEHQTDLNEYAALYEAEIGRDLTQEPAPNLQTGQATTWPDLLRFATAISKIFQDGRAVDHSWRVVLNLMATLRKSRFDAVSGAKLAEFLEIMTEAVKEETPETSHAKPGFVGRSLFRQVAAVYSRKDMGLDHGDLVKRGALGRVSAAWKFAVGRGRIPTVHAAIPATATFETAESPVALTQATNETLVRYYRTKIESLQFCGRPNFQLAVWDGLEALALTFPVMAWLTRVIATDGSAPDAAFAKALRIVDENFGFNPLLGQRKMRMVLAMIRQKNELPNLIAWYGRTQESRTN